MPALKKPKTLRALRPNAGVAASYRRKLYALVDDMQASLERFLVAKYRAEMAMDAGTPAEEMRKELATLGKRWQGQFDDAAPRLAEWFKQSVKNYSDPVLKQILKDGGFSVTFTVTPAMQNILDTIVIENVGLITNIAAKHLADVEGLVMRSIQRGNDQGTLVKELRERYGMTRRRAALIATDQNNKATSVINRTRQKEIGITHAIWKHSRAGKHPRPTHVAADGLKFRIDQGCLIPPRPGEEAVYVFPGEEINCRCQSKSILPW